MVSSVLGHFGLFWRTEMTKDRTGSVISVLRTECTSKGPICTCTSANRHLCQDALHVHRLRYIDAYAVWRIAWRWVDGERSCQRRRSVYFEQTLEAADSLLITVDHVHQDIWRWISRKPLEIEAWFQRTTNRKWHVGYRMVTWPMTSRDLERSNAIPQFA